jgi:hypothetical protein
MAIKRIAPLSPPERVLPYIPNETGNDIPREGPLPAAVYESSDFVVSSIYPVEISLFSQRTQVDPSGAVPCEGLPVACSPLASVEIAAQPITTVDAQEDPIGAVSIDDVPTATVSCRIR